MNFSRVVIVSWREEPKSWVNLNIKTNLAYVRSVDDPRVDSLNSRYNLRIHLHHLHNDRPTEWMDGFVEPRGLMIMTRFRYAKFQQSSVHRRRLLGDKKPLAALFSTLILWDQQKHTQNIFRSG